MRGNHLVSSPATLQQPVARTLRTFQTMRMLKRSEKNSFKGDSAPHIHAALALGDLLLRVNHTCMQPKTLSQIENA
jgi:hypothetical protein